MNDRLRIDRVQTDLRMEPWTAAFAQVALGVAVRSIRSAMDLLERVHAGLPVSPDRADRQEGRKPYDQATVILATIKCVLKDHLHPAVEALQRSAPITDAELEQVPAERARRPCSFLRRGTCCSSFSHGRARAPSL